MEQYDTEEHILYRCLRYRCASDEESCDTEHSDLRMGVVCIERSHVREIDDHSVCSEDCGDDDGEDPGPLDLDSSLSCDLHILSYSSHILSDLRLAEPDDDKTECDDQYECEHRNRYAARSVLICEQPDSPEVIDALPDAEKVDRVPDTVASWEDNPAVAERDNRSHSIEHDELVDTVHEERDHVARDHLPSFCLIEH